MTASKSRRGSKSVATRKTPNVPDAPADTSCAPRYEIEVRSDEDPGRAMAHTAMSSSFQSMAVSYAFLKKAENSKFDLKALRAEVADNSNRVVGGDLTQVEKMLFDQAQALQSIFAALSQRAAANSGEYMGACDTYLRLALKAQSQCRATLETLAEIKNPRQVAFIRQANVANNQQVNNGVGANHAGAENSAKSANELLAVSHEQRMDFGAVQGAGGRDPALAAVEAVDGAQDARG